MPNPKDDLKERLARYRQIKIIGSVNCFLFA
jgi:hypothetical protein